MFKIRTLNSISSLGLTRLPPEKFVVSDSMRGFPDVASREPMKARFYEGDLWKRELEATLMPMIDRYDVVLVDDPQGLIRW